LSGSPRNCMASLRNKKRRAGTMLPQHNVR